MSLSARRSIASWSRAVVLFGAACAVAAALLLGCAAPLAREASLRVATSGDYAPFSEAGPSGFDVEIAEAFARDSGRTLEWVPFRWPDLTASLVAGRFDVAMSGVTVRPERSVAGRFSLPVARTGAVLVLDAALRDRLAAAAVSEEGDEVAGLAVRGLRVGVNAGGHLERVTRRHLHAARIRAIPDNAAVPRALAAGEVDAVVTDTLEAPHWLAELPGAVAVGPFTADFKAYWMPADDADLARRLDDWLVAQEASGRLARWRTKWFGEVASTRTAAPRAALLAACDERLALMPFVAGYKREHGLAVVDPEREARVLDAAWDAVVAAADELALPAPPRAPVLAFYRAQIDVAVEVQRRLIESPAEPTPSPWDLATELRPALIRIGDRMARLLVRLAHSQHPPNDGTKTVASGEELPSDLAVALGHHGVSPASLDAIARALDALQSGAP
jgi:cyclohexadienyl dehydratase